MPKSNKVISTVGKRRSKKSRGSSMRKAGGLVALARGRGGLVAPLRTGGFTGSQSELKMQASSGAYLPAVNPPGTAANVVANITSLVNNIAGGSRIYDRVGNRINLKSVLLRVKLVPTSSSVTVQTTQYMVRCCLVWDAQSNGANATTDDIFDQTGPLAAGGQAWVANSMAPLNLANRDRFRTVWEDTLHGNYVSPAVVGTGALPQSGQKDYCEGYVRMNKDVVFPDNLAGIPRSGNLLLVFMGAAFSAGGTGQPCSVFWTARARFADP